MKITASFIATVLLMVHTTSALPMPHRPHTVDERSLLSSVLGTAGKDAAKDAAGAAEKAATGGVLSKLKSGVVSTVESLVGSTVVGDLLDDLEGSSSSSASDAQTNSTAPATKRSTSFAARRRALSKRDFSFPPLVIPPVSPKPNGVESSSPPVDPGDDGAGEPGGTPTTSPPPGFPVPDVGGDGVGIDGLPTIDVAPISERRTARTTSDVSKRARNTSFAARRRALGKRDFSFPPLVIPPVSPKPNGVASSSPPVDPGDDGAGEPGGTPTTSPPPGFPVPDVGGDGVGVDGLPTIGVAPISERGASLATGDVAPIGAETVATPEEAPAASEADDAEAASASGDDEAASDDDDEDSTGASSSSLLSTIESDLSNILNGGVSTGIKDLLSKLEGSGSSASVASGAQAQGNGTAPAAPAARMLHVRRDW